MHITCFDTDAHEREYLTTHLGSQGTLVCSSYSISVEEVKKYPETTHLVVFIYSEISVQILDELPHLQAIFTMSTGFDHIDIEACKERGITVHNVPTYGNVTVAEHTFALILSLSRNIYDSIKRTEGLNFNPEGLRGFDLAGKTLGIIGMGRIGSHVASIAQGFSLNVIAYDPYPRQELEEQFGFQYTDFRTVLQSSDIVTLHTAYRPETHHLINMDNISLMKPHSYLINTARGGLIETSALLYALQEGILAGAGLDVLEEECGIREERELLKNESHPNCNLTTVLQGHMLIKDPRVIVTPHNAFNSHESIERILSTTAETIIAHSKGDMQNQVG